MSISSFPSLYLFIKLNLRVELSKQGLLDRLLSLGFSPESAFIFKVEGTRKTQVHRYVVGVQNPKVDFAHFCDRFQSCLSNEIIGPISFQHRRRWNASCASLTEYSRDLLTWRISLEDIEIRSLAFRKKVSLEVAQALHTKKEERDQFSEEQKIEQDPCSVPISGTDGEGFELLNNMHLSTFERLYTCTCKVSQLLIIETTSGGRNSMSSDGWHII
jgi:hypothetical protein